MINLMVLKKRHQHSILRKLDKIASVPRTPAVCVYAVNNSRVRRQPGGEPVFEMMVVGIHYVHLQEPAAFSLLKSLSKKYQCHQHHLH